MKRKILALFDSDINYMEKLYRYLNDSGKIGFMLCAFTNEDKLSEFLRKEKIDYLLASEDKNVEGFAVGKIIYIYADAQKDGISRYSPADEVVERLIEIIGIDEITGVGLLNARTKLIGVYSPVGRIGKTSFCTVFGQMLAKTKKVLYLNFESFSGMPFSGSSEKKGDLADVLYYFKNIRQEFKSKFGNCIINFNGLDMIKSAYYFPDISYVTPEIWEEFLNELTMMNEYDYIIMDLSDYLQGLFDSFLSRCFIVYTLTANDTRAQNKVFHYERILNEYRHDDILQKTRKFAMPVIRNLPNETDRLLYTELADFVRKATEADFDL
ncbi:MAG: hypothetical protein J5856_04780 [Lachnospiraceae bacterium]|nr:hypothetical protein [Lachnospiraceae bacterium]